MATTTKQSSIFEQCTAHINKLVELAALHPDSLAEICSELANQLEHWQTRLPSPEPETTLEFGYMPDEWVIGKGHGFEIRLLDKSGNKVNEPKAGVKFSVTDAFGKCCDDIEVKRALSMRKFVDGTFLVRANEIKFKAVSTKRGGFIVLRAHLESDNASCAQVKHAEIRLRVRSKPCDKRDYTPSMPVLKMKGIGPETGVRLSKCNIHSIQDLAGVALPGEENEQMFQTVLASIRRPRGRTTDKVLRRCIQDARLCVERCGASVGPLHHPSSGSEADESENSIFFPFQSDNTATDSNEDLQQLFGGQSTEDEVI